MMLIILFRLKDECFHKLLFSCICIRHPEDIEILHGDVMGLSDTVNFLKSLSELDVILDSGKSIQKLQKRERKAAASLFNWEVFFESFNMFSIFLLRTSDLVSLFFVEHRKFHNYIIF